MHARAGYPLSALAMLCLLFGGVECAAVDTPAPTVLDPPASLAVSPKHDTLNAIGDTVMLVAAARDRNGQSMPGARITWRSLEPAVATVAANGAVISRGDGSARIIASSGDNTEAGTDTAWIDVRQVVASVGITPRRVTLAAGDSIRLAAVAADSNLVPLAKATFDWHSSDTGAVVVTAAGLARARVAREAAVTATIDGHSATAVVTVTASAPMMIQKLAGDGQTGPAAEALSQSLVVRLVDAYGNPVSHMQVNWRPGAGNGTIAADSLVSDGDGVARARWTLGARNGSQSVVAFTAGYAGLPPVFLATATPNATITGAVVAPPLQQTNDAPISRSPRGETPTRPTVTSKSYATGDATARMLVPAPNRVAPRRVAPGQPAAQPGNEVVAGSLIVTFRPEPIGAPTPEPGSRAPMSRAVASSINLRLRDRLTTMASSARFTVHGTSPALLAARVRVDPARVDEVRRQLESDPAVESVRPEARYHAFEDRILRPVVGPSDGPNLPNDPYYAPQAWHYAAIGLPDAWRITTGSASVLVAVVDDGVRFDHPDIAPNLTSDGYDFVSNDQAFVCGDILSNAGDGDGYDPDPTNPMDYDCWTGGPSQFGDHGLHVAGTIGAAGNDGIGVTGINWTVRIRPVRGLGLGGGTDYDIAQAILYAAGLPADNGKLGTVQAATGARVINMSFGGGQDTPLLHNAIKAAAKAGALLVAAAGNSGSSRPLYPAAYDEVLAVSAVGPDMRLASYSSFGPKVGIAAPGGDIDTGSWSFAIASTMWDYTTNSPTYAFAAGTSMASPHVTGVAALVLSAEPTLTAAQLRERLTTYAVDLGARGRDDYYGAGLVNARNALTQTYAPVRPTYAVLYDAISGAQLKSMPLAADAKYLFKGLADGTYFVFAGEGDEAAGAIAEPGLRWAALGGTALTPKVVTVSGAGMYGGQVTLSLPSEREPNDDARAANRLMLGGYAVGRLNSELDIDRYVVTLPAGEYVFETSGWSGACGYALDADTIVEVYAADGTLVGSNDDIDGNRLNYCSRVEAKVPAGTYTLVVGGYWGGTYRVMAHLK